MAFDSQSHWETIYSEKDSSKVSWFQASPLHSLGFIKKLSLSAKTKIIDIGGGDAHLVDELLDMGFEQISVLDLSAQALLNSKNRLGHKGEKVNWICSNIVDFVPTGAFDFWHDRAAFHFLREAQEIETYQKIATKAIPKGGHLLIATFSDEGPLKCSGLEISRYNEEQIASVFKSNFKLIESKRLLHATPFDTEQEFLFSLFIRI
jgi:2-polyprenyl-3-methyl-5-hydroxy-6-metoxy-1,4-benzoquinol methylase